MKVTTSGLRTSIVGGCPQTVRPPPLPSPFNTLGILLCLGRSSSTMRTSEVCRICTHSGGRKHLNCFCKTVFFLPLPPAHAHCSHISSCEVHFHLIEVNSLPSSPIAKRSLNNHLKAFEVGHTSLFLVYFMHGQTLFEPLVIAAAALKQALSPFSPPWCVSRPDRRLDPCRRRRRCRRRHHWRSRPRPPQHPPRPRP